MEVIMRKTAELVPYEKNTKKHDKTQIDNVAESIKQFGFVQPVVIDENNVIVIGHCRVLAAKKLKLKEVPCVLVSDLTPEQVNALRIVDNKSNESEWDFDFLLEELPEVDLSAFDFDFGFKSDTDMPDFEELDREFKERMAAGELSEEDEEYQEFLSKFERKKTTDDCYTPDNIYNVVRDWCIDKYKLHGLRVIRPFYPGGDYQNEDYSGDCVVIDNPPFSILSEICRWYTERGVKYFMFGPHLTIFSANSGKENYVITNTAITYENGANVNTAFVTNLGNKKITISNELYKLIKEENEINLRKVRATYPKYEYPAEVITATMCGYMARHGVDTEIDENDVYFIRQLDSQKESDKGLFGCGFLLSEKATAEKVTQEKAAQEKAAQEKNDSQTWTLSERERQIVKSLGKVVPLNG